MARRVTRKRRSNSPRTRSSRMSRSRSRSRYRTVSVGGMTPPVSSPQRGRARNRVGNAYRNGQDAYGAWRAYTTGGLPAAAAYAAGAMIRRGSRRNRSTGGVSIYGGNYGGRFRSASKSYSKKLKVFLNNGFVDTQEISGTIADPDCVYLQHSAIDADKQINMMLKCMLRKLLKKSIGWDCENAEEVIPVEESTGEANALRIDLVMENVDTGVYTTESCLTYQPIGTTYRTIQQIANYQNFNEAIRKYAQGIWSSSSALNLFKLKYLRCYKLDFAPVGENFRLCGQLEFEAETVHVQVKSDMKIQNRSLSASGSSSTDTVNNNPLVGYVYNFKTGTPHIRQKGAFLLETTGGLTAVSLVRAAQLPNSFKEPPIPGVFYGCESASKVRLEPGEIKKGTVMYTSKINCLKFIKNLGFAYNTYANNASYKAYHVLGKCQLFALEDVINVNALEKIQCAYEVNREIAMYTTTKKVVPSIGVFESFTRSNDE